MIRVDPYKLLSRDLSVMDVVRAVNDQNLILPAGDVKMGPFDQYLYSNSLVDNMAQLNDIPLKTVGDSWVPGERYRQGGRLRPPLNTISCESPGRSLRTFRF